jgi:hypothetical protein
MKRHHVFLLLIIAACSPKTGPGGDTAGTTTSPDGEDSGETDTAYSESPTDQGADDFDDEGENTGPPTTSGIVPDDTDDMLWGDECDPFAQDCPEGEKCVPYASTGGTWDANKCVPITGDDLPGEACTYGGVVEATDSCDGSSHCWEVQEVDGQMVGTCRAFCQGTVDAPVCPEGTSCLISNQGTINLCILTCDPVASDCPEGLTCSWVNEGFNCIPVTDGGSQPGDPCEMAECGPSLVCLDGAVLPECAATACCAQWCSLANPVCTWMGTECVSFFEGEPPDGYEDVGVCIVPGP